MKQHVLWSVLMAAAAVAAAPMALGGVPEQPTFAKDVAPIFYAKCVSCHRPGGVAPMSLLTYEEARPWAKSIGQNVGGRVMPPWHADPGFGPFKNDRSLTEDEVATIVKWVETGARPGDAKDLPALPELPKDDWSLGEPDYVFELGPFDVKGGGPDQFKNFTHPTDFGEDKWLRAVQIRPGNPKVVHHVILWKGSEAGGNQQGWLDAWAAGADATVFPEGTGRMLEKGSSIIGDMHYHPTDTDETDLTRVGLYFADPKDVKKELVNLWIMNAEFEIPAGDPNYQATATYTFQQDSHILSLAPHMHYRGKDFTYIATFPDGRKETLLKVSKYDFNWQTAYEFEKPIPAPKGTRIDCIAHWDNSANNPANPDPTRNVRFGPESTDEMMIGFADFIVDEGVRPKVHESPVIAKMAELVEKYPGEVFEVMIPSGGRMAPSAMHIPKQGQGGWYVEFNNVVGIAPIIDITWTGDAFEATAKIPGQGDMKLSGKVDVAAAKLELTLDDGRGSSTIPGRLVK